MRLEGHVEKGWGSEFIFATTDKYCGKLLKFNQGAEFSMHFHAEKDETWLVLSGHFKVEWIDTKNATVNQKILVVGDAWHNPPLVPHRLSCLSADGGTLVEVSTPDSVEDNHRILPGDSQK